MVISLKINKRQTPRSFYFTRRELFSKTVYYFDVPQLRRRARVQGVTLDTGSGRAVAGREEKRQKRQLGGKKLVGFGGAPGGRAPLQWGDGLAGGPIEGGSCVAAV